MTNCKFCVRKFDGYEDDLLVYYRQTIRETKKDKEMEK